MYQQWLQLAGRFFDRLGLRSALTGFRGDREMCRRAEKVRLERESLARSFSGPGEARMLRFDSVLSPSHPDSRWTAVSLRGETAHPILVAPCRVGPDEFQQLFGKRRTISQIVAPLFVEGSYPIPSSHWSLPPQLRSSLGQVWPRGAPLCTFGLSADMRADHQRLAPVAQLSGALRATPDLKTRFTQVQVSVARNANSQKFPGWPHS